MARLKAVLEVLQALLYLPLRILMFFLFRPKDGEE